MVKIILLKNDTVLISEVEEVGADIGEPDCLLTNPFKIIGKHEENLPPEETFVRWLDSYTKDDKFMLRSDDVLTFMDPHEKLTEHYNEISK